MDEDDDPSLTLDVSRIPRNPRIPKNSPPTSFQVFVFFMLVLLVMMVVAVMTVMLVMVVVAVMMLISDVAGSWTLEHSLKIRDQRKPRRMKRLSHGATISNLT